MSLEYGIFQRVSARLLYIAQKRNAHLWLKRYGITLRPSTTDAAQLYDVVINEPYAFPVSFSPRAIVDVGANVGFASIQLSLAHKESIVYAYEPEPENFKTLMSNTETFPNIYPLQKVVTPFPDQEVGCYSRGGEWGFVFESIRPENEKDFAKNEIIKENFCALPTISLSQVVEENHLSSDGRNLLKINIAGFEHELFTGDLSWMSAFGAIAVRVPWPMETENQAALNKAIFESGFPFNLRAFNTLLLFERADLA